MLIEWCSEFELFLPGTIVQVTNSTRNGKETDLPNTITIFETICLKTFPSHRDFKGSITIVENGTNVLILSVVGRPIRAQESMAANNIKFGGWGIDVYSVLVGKDVRQVLRCQLSAIQNN